MKINDQSTVKIEQLKRWSPVWIIPLVTVFIGLWIIFYNISHQGPEFTLITNSAEDITAGKTAVKSRSVDVGIVKSVTLSQDLSKVIIKARLNAGMNKLLNKDSVFWVVKPQVDKEGISGLNTLLSGAYIELQPGSSHQQSLTFNLLDSPPLAPPDAKGIRIYLLSKQAGQLTPGDPVLFRGFRVGSIETSKFDPATRAMQYQLFIKAPYDRLVTKNVRFWKESGIALNMSTEGVQLEVSSLSTLFSGGISFDVPEGWGVGEPAKNNAEYILFPNQKSIQDSLFTRHKNFLLLFNQSVRGLQPGAPVEFRGIRLGTVAEVPFYFPSLKDIEKADYRIPVLIRLEPDRLKGKLGEEFNVDQYIQTTEKKGLRATLKSANLITGALYIDLDFIPNAKPWKGPKLLQGYPIIPTDTDGLAQIENQVTQALDKFNHLPLNKLMVEMTQVLQDSQKTLFELNRSLRGFQPGSPAYTGIVQDMQHLDQVLRELRPVLNTLNEKSNALIFQAPTQSDPTPRKAQK